MTTVTVVAPPDTGSDGIGTYAGDLVGPLSAEADVTWVDLPVGTSNPVPFVRAAVAAGRSDSDVIHVQHEYGLFGPVSILSWVFFPLLWLLATARGRPLVVTAHSAWDRETLDDEEGLLPLKWLYLLANNHLLAGVADRLIFLSENCKESFLETVPWADHVVFEHGVPLEERLEFEDGEARSVFDYEESDTLVVEPGYLREQKGNHLLVDVARRCPDVQFLLAGGPLNPGDESYVEGLRANAPENVQITGVLDDRAFQAAFEAADLVALPYLEMTQSGVFNWCAAFGAPVAASDHEYFRRLDNEWGCVARFDVSDLEGITETIRRLLGDEGTRRRLAESIESYGQAHSLEGVARRHVELYRSLSA